MQPIMLLDVDGVLNVPGGSGSEVVLSGAVRCVSREGAVIWVRSRRFWPTAAARGFIHWAWERFRVYWLTAWYESANLIAAWAGVPPARALHEGRSRLPGDWKVKAIGKGRFRCDPRRRIVWVEDGFSPEARGYAGGRRDLRLVATRPREGVTQSTIRRIERAMEN